MASPKKHQYQGYHLWYERVTKTWRAAQFSPQGKQLTNALIAETKTGIKEEVDREQGE